MDNYNNLKYFKHDAYSVSKDGTPCVLATPQNVLLIYINNLIT